MTDPQVLRELLSPTRADVMRAALDHYLGHLMAEALRIQAHQLEARQIAADLAGHTAAKRK